MLNGNEACRGMSMRRVEVAEGAKYGQLTVIREVGAVGKRRFLCKCDCGNATEVRLDHLQSGHTSSCGQCGVEYAGKKMTIKEWAESHGIKESTLRARLKTMNMREALGRK
jgi:hypothetical protein